MRMKLEYLSWFRDDYFGKLPTDACSQVQDLIIQHDLNLAMYSVNAELSILATNFIKENDKKLLFRIYVPSGRMWAAEADKLLALFRDWLSQVKGQRIRQDGYTTNQGKVYEFYGDGELGGANLSKELENFSDFLELCVNDPDAARQLLDRENVERATSSGLVTRYAKETRRLQLDLKHERESRLLSMRQRLQTELLEDSLESEGVADLVDKLMPSVSGPLGSLNPSDAWSLGD